MSIVKAKEFPTRLRLFNILRRAFNVDLLLYKTPSGLNLLLDFNDWVQSQIYYHGNYEKLSLAAFKDLAKESKVILDLGAHIGQYALECAQEDKTKEKQIIAVEVNPKTFTYLLNNIQINDFTQVKPVLGALYNDKSIVNIGIPAYWNMGNTQISSEDSQFDSFYAASLNVQELLRRFNLAQIDLVKMDVEGQELNIISDFFDNKVYPANIIFEFIPTHYDSAQSVVQLLSKNGYEIRDIHGQLYDNAESVTEQNLIAKRTTTNDL
jgi:FkbM family methyltransferase